MITRKTYIILMISVFLGSSAFAQQDKLISLSDAINIAADKSPEVQKSRLNMLKNEEYLNAQLYALKSRITFNVTPLQYQNVQQFDERSA